VEHCRTDLSDPHLRQRNIADIALGWGFSDAAHFSRCFKRVNPVHDAAIDKSSWMQYRETNW